MTDVCGKQIWKKGRGLVLEGHCGLAQQHIGRCMLQVETRAEAERMSTKQLDLDLTEAWKPIRDLPGGDEYVYGVIDDGLIPEHLISDED